MQPEVLPNAQAPRRQALLPRAQKTKLPAGLSPSITSFPHR